MKRNKLAFLSITLSFSLLFSSTALAANMKTVYFDQVNKVFNQSTNINGNLLVNGSQLAEYLGANYGGNSINVIFSKDDKELKLTVGSTEATLITKTEDTTTNTSKKIVLSTAPIVLDNVVVVPLRSICEAFDSNISWNADTNSITVNTDRNFVSSLELSDNIKDTTSVYTYDEAVTMAIKNSKTIKDQKESFDDLEDTLDDNNDNLSSIFQATDDATYVARTKIMVANREIEYALRLEDEVMETLELGVELSLINTLDSIKNSNMNRETLESSIAIAETNLNNTQIKYDLDLASANDVTEAQKSLDDLKRNLNSLEISYKDSVRNLNDLLGLDLESDTVVEYTPVVSDFNMTELDLEKYITNSILKNTNLKSLKNAIDSAEFNLTMLTTRQGADEKKARIEAIADANEAYNNAKESFELSLRDLYSSINALEKNNETLQANLTSNIKDYNNLVVNYTVGNITSFELEQAETAILSAEINIVSNALKYNTAIYTFNNPNLIQ